MIVTKKTIRSSIQTFVIAFIEWIILFAALPICLLAMLLISFVCVVFQGWPVFYYSSRIGKNKQLFKMIKFRTMRCDAPVRETHNDMQSYVTGLGRVLRVTSLDELPQVLNVFMGQMSLVGPRPCLPSQKDVVRLRDQKAIFSMKPGLTGLAQVRGRDFLSTRRKVKYEEVYLNNENVKFFLKILCMSFKVIIQKVNIRY